MNQISKLLYSLAENNIKIGEIRSFSGSTIPPRWKQCNGSVISRETYSKLFDVLGTNFGGGDGSTTFAIPDMNGRGIVGVGESSATGHTAHALGQMAGEETHALSGGEMAWHVHYSATGYQWRVDNDSNNKPILSYRWFDNDPWSGNITGYTGSNTGHNTMQPYVVCNYIIYTGVDA